MGSIEGGGSLKGKGGKITFWKQKLLNTKQWQDACTLEFYSQSEDLFGILNLFSQWAEAIWGSWEKGGKGKKFKMPRVIYVEVSTKNSTDAQVFLLIEKKVFLSWLFTPCLFSTLFYSLSFLLPPHSPSNCLKLRKQNHLDCWLSEALEQWMT